MNNERSRRQTIYLAGISLIAACGGFLFGFDMTVVSGALPFLKTTFDLDSGSLGWAASSCVFGCIFGAAIAGKAADLFGRKRVLLVTALVFGASSVGAGWAASFQTFVACRLAAGLAVGAASSIAPIYIAETTPASLRGRYVSFYQLAVCLGLVGCYFSNYYLLSLGQNAWRWMFAVGVVPSTLFFIFLFFVPESPRWLVYSGREAEALAVLEAVGGMDHAKSELAIINRTLREDKAGIGDLLKPGVLRIVIIGALLGAFSQLTGANAIFLYAPEIFSEAGATLRSSFLQSTLTGLVLLAFTFVPIFFVERIGRKPILIGGLALMALALGALTVLFTYARHEAQLILAAILFYIAAYASSIACITWVVLSEIFPNRVRSRAMATANLCLWSANFALLQTFPIFVKHFSPAAPFAIYVMVCVMIILFVWRFIPETKGKSLEQIELMLAGGEIDSSTGKLH